MNSPIKPEHREAAQLSVPFVPTKEKPFPLSKEGAGYCDQHICTWAPIWLPCPMCQEAIEKYHFPSAGNEEKKEVTTSFAEGCMGLEEASKRVSQQPQEKSLKEVYRQAHIDFNKQNELPCWDLIERKAFYAAREKFVWEAVARAACKEREEEVAFLNKEIERMSDAAQLVIKSHWRPEIGDYSTVVFKPALVVLNSTLVKTDPVNAQNENINNISSDIVLDASTIDNICRNIPFHALAFWKLMPNPDYSGWVEFRKCDFKKLIEYISAALSPAEGK